MPAFSIICCTKNVFKKSVTQPGGNELEFIVLATGGAFTFFLLWSLKLLTGKLKRMFCTLLNTLNIFLPNYVWIWQWEYCPDVFNWPLNEKCVFSFENSSQQIPTFFFKFRIACLHNGEWGRSRLQGPGGKMGGREDYQSSISSH